MRKFGCGGRNEDSQAGISEAANAFQCFCSKGFFKKRVCVRANVKAHTSGRGPGTGSLRRLRKRRRVISPPQAGKRSCGGD